MNILSKFPRWLWILLITIAALWLLQQIMIKPVVEIVCSKVIGARVKMGSFSLNPFSQELKITHLQIYNEEGFPSKIFFDAPEIRVNIDLPQAMKGKIHCPLVVFNLNRMIVFKNAQGKLNVDQLKIVQEKLHEKNKGPAPNFKIDLLNLNIEQVLVEDDSKSPPTVEAYDLNLKNKTIRNIDGAPKLVGFILVEALKPTAIQSAGLYAATALLGVGFLPGLAVGLAVANDHATTIFSDSKNGVYQKTLRLMERLGKVKKEDRATGQIAANVYGCDISIVIQDMGWNKTKITIKARKYFLPKPEIAAGLIYQLKN